MPLIEKFIQFTGKYRFLAHFTYWLGTYVLTMARYKSNIIQRYTFSQELINSLFFVGFAAITSYFLAYFVLPRLLAGRHYIRTLIISIIALYFIMALSRVSVIYFMEPMIRPRPFEQESPLEIFTDLEYLFWNYFIHAFSFAFVFIFMKLLKDQYVVNKRAMILEKQKADIELTALKAQLNPHFLFNTLNNIYSLSVLQSPRTSSAIARLSEILDTLLYRSDKMFVPVSQEITLLQNYIELERLRYDERLKISFQHQIERDIEIAPLILLSLVENAFKHGAGEDAGCPEIVIRLNQKQELLSFGISNTFKAKGDQQWGIGLENIRKQLALLYPETHTFETTIIQHVFTAKLELRLNQPE
ncbi:sensor histidine kinase [Chitinophaga pendula]|uniref:sensor histidine kinase n=1 Tax=Chitinophaga TaxID=79328 RepID=UPI000BAF1E63|nr:MULTISPECIES: sensor histidine kinase [Chitinophaga]ASZ12473.1 histidine kinase [Chitinophaga sp. MD30]UCJ09927.1 sensor histidine kinase [Chitinophaga pendula]